MVFVRGIIVWLVIILAESLHGTARRFLLEPYVGEFRASQIGVFMGAAIILVISIASVRWIGASSVYQLLGVGLIWLILTLSFEFLLGRLVLGYSWERIIAEYNLRKGGLMAIGLMALMVSPVVAARWQGIISQRIAAN
jgi:hypothetical protein